MNNQNQNNIAVNHGQADYLFQGVLNSLKQAFEVLKEVLLSFPDGCEIVAEKLSQRKSSVRVVVSPLAMCGYFYFVRKLVNLPLFPKLSIGVGKTLLLENRYVKVETPTPKISVTGHYTTPRSVNLFLVVGGVTVITFNFVVVSYLGYLRRTSNNRLVYNGSLRELNNCQQSLVEYNINNRQQLIDRSNVLINQLQVLLDEVHGAKVKTTINDKEYNSNQRSQNVTNNRGNNVTMQDRRNLNTGRQQALAEHNAVQGQESEIEVRTVLPSNEYNMVTEVVTDEKIGTPVIPLGSELRIKIESQINMLQKISGDIVDESTMRSILYGGSDAFTQKTINSLLDIIPAEESHIQVRSYLQSCVGIPIGIRRNFLEQTVLNVAGLSLMLISGHNIQFEHLRYRDAVAPPGQLSSLMMTYGNSQQVLGLDGGVSKVSYQQLVKTCDVYFPRSTIYLAGVLQRTSVLNVDLLN
jgi:flagellin-specific chaperone FliS